MWVYIVPLPHRPAFNLFWPLVLLFCWRKNIGDNKKDIAFLLVWDKDSYTERFLALLPCTCVLQPKLIHLYQISSLLPSPLSIVALVSLRFLHLLLYSEYISHIQVLGLLPFPYSSRVHSPISVWPMSSNVKAFVLGLHSSHEREHAICGLLSLANFAYDNVLQFHHLLVRQNFILLCGWIKFHCV
jgi:hypothetical protein